MSWSGCSNKSGVKHIFGLIGDSLNPLADAIRRSRIEWVGVRHEEGAALAAAGQAKLTGCLGVCAGTTGPGSNHLVAGLYEATRDHAPVLALSGDMPRKFHGTDYIQTTEPDLLFRDVMRFDGNGRFSILCGNGIAEAILTVASGGSDSAFLKLRHYLNEQGLTITARTIEDIPHPECLVQLQATYEQLVRNYSADLSAASEHDTGSPVNIMTTHRGPEIGPSDTNDQ